MWYNDAGTVIGVVGGISSSLSAFLQLVRCKLGIRFNTRRIRVHQGTDPPRSRIRRRGLGRRLRYREGQRSVRQQHFHDMKKEMNWLCTTFVQEERTWFWSDGGKFNFNAWGKSEPNNLGGNENCMMINLSGTEVFIFLQTGVFSGIWGVGLDFVCSFGLIWLKY